MTHDTWHMTCDMWHATCDMWHVVGSEHSLKISAPSSSGLWLGGKGWLTDSLNDWYNKIMCLVISVHSTLGSQLIQRGSRNKKDDLPFLSHEFYIFFLYCPVVYLWKFLCVIYQGVGEGDRDDSGSSRRNIKEIHAFYKWSSVKSLSFKVFFSRALGEKSPKSESPLLLDRVHLDIESWTWLVTSSLVSTGKRAQR